jgi:prepilin-type processing-associated H-X9-DG protein
MPDWLTEEAAMLRRRRALAPRPAVTLVELLVVVGIIALLMGILIRGLARARRSARAAVCLSNLRQWGHAHEMYRNANRGRAVIEWHGGRTGLFWWELLAPYNGDVPGTLVCPEATAARDDSPDRGDGVPRKAQRGTAGHAWRVASFHAAEPQWVLRGDWRGSYGFNEVLYTGTRLNSIFVGVEQFGHPPKSPERIPLLGDCVETGVSAGHSVPPKNVQDPEDYWDLSYSGDDLPAYCIDRHGTAVNVVFLDGHAERVTLPGLWKLQWSANFESKDVVVPRP